MSREDQLKPQLRAFFRASPSEALSYDDIAEKFDCTREQARRACERLRIEGFMVTTVVAMLNPDRQRT